MPKSKLPPFQRARQPKQIEQRQEAILEAALVLFQKKGLENVTLADIAEKVGTVKSNIYRYFDSREHIYLRVLQRQGSEWEKRVLPALEALQRKGTVAKVAEVLTRSFIQSVEYSTLITVINPVLEKALSPELVIDFRSAFFERRKRLAQALAAALPRTRAEAMFPLTVHIFTHVVGLWPLCHPSADSEKLLKDPAHAHLNLNFEVEMTQFLRRLLK
ncbi:MAG TPA: TetR family transcriptional regulator [Chthoniobacterales bacterium]|jgi:AcrR family transcriptional regulator